jgi:lantibiotic modifying enzyme
LVGWLDADDRERMPPLSTWSPLFDGSVRDRALGALEGITQALATPERLASLSPYLSGGRAGVSMLFSYLARTRAQPGHVELAEHLLDEAGEAVASMRMVPDLFSGFTGISWAIEHLRGTLDPEEDPLTGIDEALEQMLQTRPWTYHYELVSGLVGQGVYALERLPRDSARRCLEQIVARLTELAEPTKEGLRWWTPPPLVAEQMRGRFPHGACCLGVAHGIPGVLVILAGAVAAGVAASQARELLETGWTWLMAQRLPDTASSRFPTWFSPDAQIQAFQPAWCYGDPGLALTLLLVARTVGEPTWEQQALEFCRETVRRWSDVEKTRDPGLCHGAAGLGHLYNRIFHVTGEGLFAEAARTWFTRALSLHRPGQGVGGFFSLEFEPDGSDRWMETPGLLTGSAGIGLGLLAAVSSLEPSWDRMLLMSLRPLAPTSS